jgi:hypothetical protein
VLEGAAFGAVGNVVGGRLFPTRGFKPHKLSNIRNPGVNTQRLYGQGAVGGTVSLRVLRPMGGVSGSPVVGSTRTGRRSA